MLLYLTVLQILAHLCAHLVNTKTGSSILLVLIILGITSVGGYVIHIGEIPSYLWWSESFSPQRWLLPVIIANEFTQETLANTAGQQLCRNKHVSCFVFQKNSKQNKNSFSIFAGSKTGNYCPASMSSTKWNESIGRSLVTPGKPYS